MQTSQNEPCPGPCQFVRNPQAVAIPADGDSYFSIGCIILILARRPTSCPSGPTSKAVSYIPVGARQTTNATFCPATWCVNSVLTAGYRYKNKGEKSGKSIKENEDIIYDLIRLIRKVNNMYFEKAGKENTQRTLQIAKEEALKRGIHHIVVASTLGDTGLAAAQMLKGTGIKLIVVTHNTGIREPNLQTFDPEIKKKIESMGGKVHTGTMVLRSLGTALKERGSLSYEQTVADTLRIFGQGTKVVVEIVAMSADAGLIPFSDVIAVAGTGTGADTAVLIKANSSNRFFDIKLREYLVKPLDF